MIASLLIYLLCLQVSDVFSTHWYWKRYSQPSAEGNAVEKELRGILARRSKEADDLPSTSSGDDGRRQWRDLSSEGPASRQGVFDSSRSVMRFSEAAAPIEESTDEREHGVQMQDLASPADDSLPQQHTPAETPAAQRGGKFESPGLSDSPLQDSGAHIQDDPMAESRKGSYTNEKPPEPHFQPSPFADVPNNSQIWPALPLPE